MKFPLLFVFVEFIAKSSKLCTLQWVKLEKFFFSKSGLLVAKGVCQKFHPRIVWTNIHLVMRILELSSPSALFILKCIPLKGFCSIGGCFELLCLTELPCMIINVAPKKNSKPTCCHAITYKSMSCWHVFPII